MSGRWIGIVPAALLILALSLQGLWVDGSGTAAQGSGRRAGTGGNTSVGQQAVRPHAPELDGPAALPVVSECHSGDEGACGVAADSLRSSGPRVESVPAGRVEITKAPDLQRVQSGASAVFTITVANTGETVLTSIAVSDPLVPQSDAAFGTMAPGEYVAYGCAVPNVTESFTNVASVRATTTDGGYVSDKDEAGVVVWTRAIAVEKGPDFQIVDAGGTVTFTVAVSNTGGEALGPVGVRDPLTPAWERTIGSLSAGTGVRYVCVAEEVMASFTNVVSATGITPAGTVVSGSDDAQVRVMSLLVDKRIGIGGQSKWQKADSPPGPTVLIGTPVWFLLSVFNAGDVVLEDLTLVDSVYDLTGSPECHPPAALAPGDSFDCVVGPLEATAGQHLNSALATGHAGEKTIRARDDVYYLGYAESGAAISVEKYIAVNGGVWQDADSPDAAPSVPVGPKDAAQIAFRIMVANAGAVPLTDLRLDDPVLDLIKHPACTPPSTLAPGHGFECTVTTVRAAPCLQTNVVTAPGFHEGLAYTDSAPVYYYGVPCGTPLSYRVCLPLVLSRFVAVKRGPAIR